MTFPEPPPPFCPPIPIPPGTDTHPQPCSPRTISPRHSRPAQTCRTWPDTPATGPPGALSPQHNLSSRTPPSHEGSGGAGRGKGLTHAWPGHRDFAPLLAPGPTHSKSSISSHWAALRKVKSHWGGGGEAVNPKAGASGSAHNPQGLWSCPHRPGTVIRVAHGRKVQFS